MGRWWCGTQGPSLRSPSQGWQLGTGTLRAWGEMWSHSSGPTHQASLGGSAGVGLAPGTFSSWRADWHRHEPASTHKKLVPGQCQRDARHRARIKDRVGLASSFRARAGCAWFWSLQGCQGGQRARVCGSLWAGGHPLYPQLRQPSLSGQGLPGPPYYPCIPTGAHWGSFYRLEGPQSLLEDGPKCSTLN